MLKPEVAGHVKTVYVVCSELLDDIQMKACNQYSHLDYKELPTLFLEFHGSQKTTEDEALLVGMEFT